MKPYPIALAPCRMFIRVAGALIAANRRGEWQQEWLGELWFRWRALRSQGEWHTRSALQLYWASLGCFHDAWSQLTLDNDRWAGLQIQMGTPNFCAALLSAGLVCFAIGTGYFPATRTILSKLPYRNGPQVALVSRTGRLEAIRRGIPHQLAASWLKQSKLVEALAACSFVHGTNAHINRRAVTAASLEATGNLLDVIGQTVSPQVRRSLDAGEPVALLSFSFWQRELNGDPAVIGGRLQHDGRNLRIGGVLPPPFWFLSPSVQIYELNSRSVGDGAMLVIRSKPHVSAAQLEAELFQTADRNDIPFTRTAPHVLFVSSAVRTPLWLFGSSLVLALVLAGIGHGSRLHYRPSHARLPLDSWHWWLFLLGKTAIALTLVFTIGVELFVGLSRQSASEALGGPALLWFYTAGCSAVLFAVIADQQARCRVCLQCLAFPIRIGCPGCLFLDWSGTELLCPDGHGVLYVPHHVSCWDVGERWVALEI